MKIRFIIPLFILLITIPMIAQIPSTINFQGFLKDQSGLAIDGTRDFTFRIYDAATAGNQLWMEQQNSISVSKGIFNVSLGSITSFSLAFDSKYWVSIQVGTDPELSPRIELTSVPYSFRTSYADQVLGLGASDNIFSASGFVGMGTTTPTSELEVVGTVSATSFVGDGSGLTNTSPWTGTADISYSGGFVGIGTSFPNSQLHVNAATSINPFRVQVAGASKLIVLSNGGTVIGDFTSIVPTDGLYVLGDVGIGTNTPASKLDVVGTINATAFVGDGSGLTNIAGSSVWTGTTDISYSGGFVGIGTTAPLALLHVEAPLNTDALRVRVAGLTKLKVNGSNGGVAIGANASAPANGLFVAGDVGFRTTTPAADLHIKQSASPFPDPTTGGIILEEAFSADQWQIWNGNNFLDFAWNGTRMALVDHLTGDWIPVSDMRRKKNIEPMNSVLGKVMLLRPKTYHFLQNDPQQVNKTTGFLAQDVQDVFPQIVIKDKDGTMGLAYRNFAVIAIKAIQEQQVMIEELQKEIEALKGNKQIIKKIDK